MTRWKRAARSTVACSHCRKRRSQSVEVVGIERGQIIKQRRRVMRPEIGIAVGHTRKMVMKELAHINYWVGRRVPVLNSCNICNVLYIREAFCVIKFFLWEPFNDLCLVGKTQAKRTSAPIKKANKENATDSIFKSLKYFTP